MCVSLYAKYSRKYLLVPKAVSLFIKTIGQGVFYDRDTRWHIKVRVPMPTVLIFSFKWDGYT